MFIAVGLIKNIITFIKSIKITLLSSEPLNQIKLRLQPFFFEIELIFASSSTKKARGRWIGLDHLKKVQSISPKGFKKLLYLCQQLLG